MKKLNKTGYTFLIALLITCIVQPVYAIQDYTKSCVTSGNRDVNTDYRLKYSYSNDKSGKVTLTVAKGEFKIVNVEEGYIVDADENGNTIFNPAPDIRVLRSNPQDLIGQTVTSKKSLSLYVNDYSVKDERFLRITADLAKTDSNCMSKEDYDAASEEDKSKSATFTGYFYVELIDYSATNPALKLNDNYNSGACYALRTGDNSTGVIPSDYWNRYNKNGDSYYKKVAGYCYNQYVEYNYSQAQSLSIVKNAIQSYYVLNLSTTKQTVSPSFQEAFEASKNRARQAGGSHYQENVSEKTKSLSGGSTLLCDYKKIGEKKNGQYDYTNLSSFYAKQLTKESISYKNTYDGGETSVSETKEVCSRTCEEAVDVEYGPPQAAIAGFCIEYQVKVTSRVKCTSSVNPDAAPEPKTICQPRPYCVHSDGTVMTQAGPGDEYDECINKCDGGAYSPSCSKSCYQKVYGKNEKNKKLSANDKNGANLELVDNSSVATGGHYDRDANGTVIWISDKSYNTYAQWYIDHEYEKTLYDDRSYQKSKGVVNNNSLSGPGRFSPNSQGFKIRQTLACEADCSYISCASNTYLQESTASADYQRQLDQYTTAVAKCQAAATCTSKTATFKISATYSNSKENEITKEFPLSTGYSELQSLTRDGMTNSLTSDTTILSDNGCYKDSREQNWYQAEWSFPGTWVNNKTGEISFEDKSSNPAWHQSKNKFCLPLDTKNVNVNWWKWYMAQKQASSTNTFETTGSIKSNEYTSTCENLTDPARYEDSAAPDKYNINAKTESFGYFGWTFDISCFFASNDGKLEGQNKEKDKKCTTGVANYTTRTVTNDDLFPTTDESGLATATNDAADRTGRTPGFNWTQAATIPEYKNEYYAVDPKQLIGKIQGQKDKIFDEANNGEFLDYEFKLTRDDLLAIKKDNKNIGDYTTWPGETIYNDKAKIYVYRSSLFRDGGTLQNSGAAVKLAKLGCNNQHSNRCE